MSRRRVLIVDDEDDIREIAQMSLELVAGWEVLTASSGEEAATTASREQPDAVLLDVMMPGLDGPQTLARLLADPRTREIPVVFLTAKAQLTDQRSLEELGAHGVITKPFDPMGLSARVAEVLQWLD